MSDGFDKVARTLAAPQSRRSIFSLIGAGVAGAVVASLRPGKAAASPVTCFDACRNLTGQAYALCLSSCRCVAAGGTPCFGTAICCPQGTQCGGYGARPAVDGFVTVCSSNQPV